ncbi:hypothetical protein EVAR_83259_1 [Eumeta japonica]|uniref:Uncharacterized protein n=1 Tax=Eumeta variegata TaxID=151549 RepID=A0A4C1X925_EUMVA|nr:hypothetical protein EVAR_83259_1 [Eumeta japonica]
MIGPLSRSRENSSRVGGAVAFSLLLGRIGRWSGRETNASQTERLGRSCFSIARSMLSLARSAQAERDNES